MIAGSITGVGSAKSHKAVNWGIYKKLLLAWILTLPGAALVGAISYKIAISLA
jgi:PiT family inorganic phosphate transporter